MFIIFKIIFALCLIFIHYKSCFKDYREIKGKHLVFLFIGLIPVIVLTKLTFKAFFSIFTNDEELIDKLSGIYMLLVASVYTIYLLRPTFNKLANGWLTLFPKKTKSQKEFFNSAPTTIFKIQSFLFFIAGSFAIIGISLKELPNSLSFPQQINTNEFDKINDRTDQMIYINKYLKSKVSVLSIDSLTANERTFLIIDETNNEILMNGYEEYINGSQYNNHREFKNGLININANMVVDAINSIDSIIISNMLITTDRYSTIDSIYQNSVNRLDSLLIELVIKINDKK